jgi:hypothetical protein
MKAADAIAYSKKSTLDKAQLKELLPKPGYPAENEEPANALQEKI